MNVYRRHVIAKRRRQSRFLNFWLPLPEGIRVVLVCMSGIFLLVFGLLVVRWIS